MESATPRAAQPVETPVDYPPDAPTSRGEDRDRARIRSPHLAFRLGLFFAGCSVVLFGYYLTLPYRSSWFSSTSASEAGLPPRPDFRLGSLEWTVNEYQTAPELAAFRRSYAARCGKKSGLQAALCYSDAMAALFPDGIPPAEFTDRNFDPVEHLERHLSGAPGHCMNRSAILATVLLSVGIPARVVQLLPASGQGHNLVEVWDEAEGWVVLDPTRGGILGAGSRPASAARLAGIPDRVRWYALTRAPAPTSLVEELRKSRPDPRLFEGQIVYPEPWLYLRVGSRSAPWPFRGTFACTGGGALACGQTQDLLRLIIPASAAAASWLLAIALRNRRAAGS